MGRRSGRAVSPQRATRWWVAAAGWLAPWRARWRSLLLMPLKRVDPFVVRVDNSTGIVDVVPVYAGRATPEEAVTRYFLTHYVTVCERFNFATAESDYEECGAFHSAQRNQAWYALWTATNPASPLNVHKDGSTVRVQVKSVSFFTRASGLVRSCPGALPEGSRAKAPEPRSVHSLGRDHSVRLRGAGEGSEDAPLESAGLQDRRFRTEPEVLSSSRPRRSITMIVERETARPRGDLLRRRRSPCRASLCFRCVARRNGACPRRRRQPHPRRCLQRRRGLQAARLRRLSDRSRVRARRDLHRPRRRRYRRLCPSSARTIICS